MTHAELMSLPKEEARRTISRMSDLERAIWQADRDGTQVFLMSCKVGQKTLTSYTAAHNARDAFRSAQCHWLRRFNSPHYYDYKVELYTEEVANAN
jgi:hypothetical protein